MIKKIKQNKKLLILVIILIGLLITLLSIGISKVIAYYRTGFNDQDQSVVAKFDIKSNFNLSSFEETYTFECFPGKEELFSFSITNNSEVRTKIETVFLVEGTIPNSELIFNYKLSGDSTWKSFDANLEFEENLPNDGNEYIYDIRIDSNENMSYIYSGGLVTIKMVVTVSQDVMEG